MHAYEEEEEVVVNVHSFSSPSLSLSLSLSCTSNTHHGELRGKNVSFGIFTQSYRILDHDDQKSGSSNCRVSTKKR